MKRSIGILSLVVSLAVVGQPLRAQDATAPTPRMTEAQAIQIAKDFCRRIGKPVTDEPYTHFPDKLDQNFYWQSLWDVQCGRQADVRISDADGLIFEYSDDKYLRAEDATPPDPSRNLSPEQAEKIGLAFLRQTGEREELGEPSMSEDTISRTPSAHNNYFLVEWKRMFQSIPYLKEAARVDVIAETGEVIGSTIVFISPPLAADQAALAQNPATFTAKDQPQQIAALRKAAHTAAPAVLPDNQLVLVGQDNSLGEFRYDPGSGKLGMGPDWVIVPDGFRVWMQNRLSGAESKPGKKL